MVVKRGAIWWATMEEPKGSGPGYRRPVVIISSNDFNQSLIRTVICAVITSNLNLENAPGNFKLKQSKQSIHRDSVVNVSQIITLDKSFLTERIGQLSNNQINSLREGLRLALSL